MRIEAHLPAICDSLRSIAALAAPEEVCGVITIDGQLVEVRNTAAASRESFDLGPLAELEGRFGEFAGIWHTHPENQLPSPSDVAHCGATWVPWVIAGPADIFVLHPKSRGYVGREFVYGLDDCWSLVSDWHAQEGGVFLPWFERPPDGWWNSPGPSPYVAHADEYGFSIVPFAECGLDGLRIGDVILMQVAAKRVNHAALYMGGGHMLHHLYGELSRIAAFDGQFQRTARFVCRHRSLKC